MKIAFAGAGYIINIHAQAANVLQDVELVAVVEKYSAKGGGSGKEIPDLSSIRND